jgi:hypothetical protein
MIVTPLLHLFRVAITTLRQVACKLVASTMNKKYGTSWNCVAGTSYATSDVVCQQRTCLLLYYAGQFAILLYKNI